MAGANKILPKGQVLFHEGDASDGMYLVRRGELLVYLEKGGSEIKLATLGEGSMLGEMALFDKKPRSASARSLAETEVTQISNDDFLKLMKQIPKWFVSLMTTLSTRLRETNERLQKVESKAVQAIHPLNQAVKVLQLLLLISHKDAIKDGKNWQLTRPSTEGAIASIAEIEPKSIHKVTEALIKAGFFTITKDTYNNEVLNMPGRGHIEKLVEFMAEFKKDYPDLKTPPKGTRPLFQAMKKAVDDVAYENAVIAMNDLVEIGTKQSLETSNWKEVLQILTKNRKGITLTKASDGSVALKVIKAEFPRIMTHYTLLDQIAAELAA